MLEQFLKFLGIAFEYQPLGNAGQTDDGKDLAADLETKLLFPLEILSRIRK